MASTRTLRALAWTLLGAVASARQVEGPLDNDSYLPVSADAEAELARGDQAYAAALAAGSQASWTPTCEAWRNSLVRSPRGASASPRPVPRPGDPSPWPAADGAIDRFTEGVEEAVFRRLGALPPAGLAAWRERFAPLAEQELERAGALASELERVERELAATPAAARAALLLAELALERAEPSAAAGWLSRARRHAGFLGPEAAPLAAGIQRREAALPRPAAAAEPTWALASSLAPLAQRALEVPRTPASRTRALGSGAQAGLAFLDGDRALVQTPADLWLVEGEDAAVSGPFANDEWLAPLRLEVEPTVAPGSGPGWRLDPAARGTSAVVVAGRSLAGRANVLARVDAAVPGALPRLRWATLAAAEGGTTETEGAEDDHEFQPGPLWIGESVFVLVRHSSAASGERELELRAVRAEDGAPRWSRYLGKGGERVRDAGRFVRRGVPSMPAEPLVAGAGGIFASAQLGFAAVVDPLDGRARFTLKNRRREAEERGWTGWGSPAAGPGSALGWAPADSAYLYVLDAQGPGSRGTPLLAPPEPLGEGEALVAADSGSALVLARSGARWALSRWDLAAGARQDALHLGPEEVFSGRALASASRVFAASDRALYLFDRTRELALLAVEPLAGPVPRGGNVWARGSRIFVLSSRALEVFRAR